MTGIEPGYAGGHVEHPTYEQVCGKDTGHIEVARVEFDPAVLSYGDLLRVFFATHDPTTPGRQGNDVGPQYESPSSGRTNGNASRRKPSWTNCVRNRSSMPPS
ncbi:Peptide methionine sulfoxide reductase MsrA [Bordetella bronchiseptica]|nr:Peptide methionine sulfoxide reductase MsrA [Bordetella bronchiseptica]